MGNVIKVEEPNSDKVYEYFLEPKLQKFLENSVKENLEKADKDYVLGVDGYEGAGKSTFGVQIGKYVDPSLDLTRVCMTADEFKMAIIKAKKNQCVIYDEAVTGMTAGDSITRIGRLLKSMMMQMRQKNLFVIVILPSIFELNRYTVLSRIKSFFHVYELKGRRGYFAGYNKRDTRKLFLNGKKTYSYNVKSRFLGRFYGKLPIDKEGYLKKKEEALFKIDVKEEVDKREDRINRLLRFIKNYTKLPLREISTLLKGEGISIDHSNLSRRIGSIVEK